MQNKFSPKILSLIFLFAFLLSFPNLIKTVKIVEIYAHKNVRQAVIDSLSHLANNHGYYLSDFGIRDIKKKDGNLEIVFYYQYHGQTDPLPTYLYRVVYSLSDHKVLKYEQK